ncbi:hypothetical protein AC1031_011461 [Aphanomyces cochlioides]|nr:hypothetical protein AC1031_011461 [Aphanomyces cochlioides]
MRFLIPLALAMSAVVAFNQPSQDSPVMLAQQQIAINSATRRLGGGPSKGGVLGGSQQGRKSSGGEGKGKRGRLFGKRHGGRKKSELTRQDAGRFTPRNLPLRNKAPLERQASLRLSYPNKLG